MAKSRNIYRKWIDPEGEFEENYMKISPNGLMLQISFGKDLIYGEKTLVYQTSPQNPINSNTFKKHKEVCSKTEWDKARKRVKNFIT